ncbi:MAG TPA: 2OG-Fe(II) oxygenase [Sphingomonas sp.]|jgi:hypothetical protein
MGFRGSICPRHFEVDALERTRAAFRSDRFKSVVIDDFLNPLFAADLLAWFERDGVFQEHHCLKDPLPRPRSHDGDGGTTIERTVSKEDFAAAPKSSWLARELLMREEPPRDTASTGWLAHTRFLDMLTSEAFKAYLGAVTDTDDLQDVTYMARTMRHDDLCSAHSDDGDGRSLCMLLYMGTDWTPDFGGRFQNIVKGKVARSTDPLGNRLILHKPAPDQIHQVEPISEAGRHWRRHTYSVWFGTFPKHS